MAAVQGVDCAGQEVAGSCAFACTDKQKFPLARFVYESAPNQDNPSSLVVPPDGCRVSLSTYRFFFII